MAKNRRGFDEYGFYGENNPPVSKEKSGEYTHVRVKPFVTDIGRDMDEILDEAFRAVFRGEKQ